MISNEALNKLFEEYYSGGKPIKLTLRQKMEHIDIMLEDYKALERKTAEHAFKAGFFKAKQMLEVRNNDF